MKAEQAAENLQYNKGLIQSNPHLMCTESFKSGVEFAKNNLSISLLDVGLRAANIHINKDLLDKVIDVAKLIIDKGGESDLDDIEKLKLRWKCERV